MWILLSIFSQNFKIIPKLKNKQPVYKRSGSKLDSFYGAFVDVAEYLDLKQLFSACVFDPFWNRVIEILKTQKGYIFEEKTFFIYKTVLMCKLKYKNLEMYFVSFFHLFMPPTFSLHKRK